MCSDRLKKLIHSGASESEIQAYVKSDLSILGEACTPSNLKGKYIAFSEFPILVDKPGFVVFTGDSNMEIVIVEFKGADFNFLSSDVTIDANIRAAAEQVKDCFRHINANEESFRRRFYDIRRQVEAGETLYNALPGPARHLEVDPEKQMGLKGMVIGGRGEEIRKVSKVRNLLERDIPRMTYVTWDGWLKHNGQYGDVLWSNFPAEPLVP